MSDRVKLAREIAARTEPRFIDTRGDSKDLKVLAREACAQEYFSSHDFRMTGGRPLEHENRTFHAGFGGRLFREMLPHDLDPRFCRELPPHDRRWRGEAAIRKTAWLGSHGELKRPEG